MMSVKNKIFGMAAAALVAMSSSAVAQDADPDSLREIYGAWAVECSAVAENTEQVCRMSQRIVRRETQQTLLSVFIRQDIGEGEGWLTMITPFGVDLAKGVAIASDGNDVMQAAYRTCRRHGCIVQAELSETEVAAFKAGAEAKVAMPLTTGQTLELNVSLTGFSAAWARLNEF